MSTRTWWTALIGAAWVLIGIWGPWVPHRAAALVLSSWDLAEFVKFLPGISVSRELFYLPAWCTGIVLTILANQSGSRMALGWVPRVLLTFVALGLMAAILPPYPDLFSGYQSAEFRWRFFLGVGGALAVFGLLLAALWPASDERWSGRLGGAMLLVLALAGVIPALWAYLSVRSAVETVYDSRIGWGWGLAVFLVGWGLIAVSGVRLLATHGKKVS